MRALDQLRRWPQDWDVPSPAAAVVTLETATGRPALRDAEGNTARVSRIASVTKPMVAYAAMVAVEEGAVSLDEAAGPPGSTVRHLLAHTAGYLFESGSPVVARPGTRRIYSNAGIEVLADHLARRTRIQVGTYLHEAVFEPLGMTATGLRGSAAQDVWSSVDDLARFAAELLEPQLLARESLDEMVAVQYPGLDGVLPGLGKFSPLDWGLGVERNFGRERHWAGTAVSSEAFGHFGGSGSFLWVDSRHGVATVCIGGRDFDVWSVKTWPPLSSAVLDEFAA